MSTLLKIFFTILILYTFAGKFYNTVFYINLQGVNLREILFIHCTNISMLLILLTSLLLIWQVLYNKINYVIFKSKYILKPTIVIILAIQIFLFLLDILSKNPNINQFRVFILSDLPNLLSIFISIIFIIVLPSKKYLHSKNHGN
jgi:hypothetical protein